VTEPTHAAVIVGTGFSGLGMAIRLKQQGIDDFVVLEKASDVGGTWRDNTYPGCACDIPSVLYSFSFEPNHRWTRTFPEQREIWDYLRRCADSYGIRPHIRFGAELASAAYDDEGRAWRVSTVDGREFRGRALVLGMGLLHRPHRPDIPGLDSFAGPVFHSSGWRHDVDLTGKRVAVIGTGASAIQFVPRLAPEVERLHLFQRTPPWILPKGDKPIGPGLRRALGTVPGLQRLWRTALFWKLDARAVGFTTDPRLMRFVRGAALKHLRRQVPDPVLRERMTPDYTIGCKRILLSNDYYPALSRSTVELVTDAVTAVTPTGVVTADGRERPVDAIVLGTGFQVTDALRQLDLVGAGGRRLADAWPDGPEAYLGTEVAGLPDLYLLIGPNTGLGHNSMIFIIEAQLGYVLRRVRSLLSGAAHPAVRPDAQRRYNRRIQARLGRAVWSVGGCRSWYLDPDGRNRALWPGPAFRYWLTTRLIRRSDFQQN
jgi:cation diffusion facilitator CzcD-associated flavoprotein CzcO